MLSTCPGNNFVRTLDEKRHELTDHLGNVRVVITDVKKSDINVGTNLPENYTATAEAYYNYYAFGAEMNGRTFTTTAYRYGFNGKENDDELKGTGNSLDFGARIYDSRLGRWLSLDPLQSKYPSLSPFNFVLNNPLLNIDPDGKRVKPTNTSGNTAFTTLLESFSTNTRTTTAMFGLSRGEDGTYSTSFGASLESKDFKSKAKAEVKAASGDKLRMSRKQWEKAYTVYLALATEERIEAEVVFEGTPGAMNTVSPQQVGATGTILAPDPPYNIGTHNRSRQELLSDIGSAGAVNSTIANNLFLTNNVYPAEGRSNNEWVYFSNSEYTPIDKRSGKGHTNSTGGVFTEDIRGVVEIRGSDSGPTNGGATRRTAEQHANSLYGALKALVTQ